jgi:hypothetical protein
VVEYAYTAAEPSDPVVSPAGDPLFAQQGYLSAGPAGIGVQAAWNKGADGQGKNFIDIEQGWFLAHEDLPSGIRLLTGVNSPKSFPHGCAVLGEIVGVDNNVGVVGAAPNATAAAVSYFKKDEAFNSGRSRHRIADSVMFATTLLAPGTDGSGDFGDGGCLLLEVQVGGKVGGSNTLVPVETDPAIFEAIRLATKVRVIVVEAAGNGGVRLDDYLDASNRRVLARGTPDFRESGAIMVGACLAALPHAHVAGAGDPPTRSNFGTRVDCYAWGERVVTTGNPDHPADSHAYWDGAPRFFGGTSSAAPIILGACLLLQNLQAMLRPKSGITGALSPARMREILSKPGNGTTSPDQIGVMPDFAKIIANEFR